MTKTQEYSPSFRSTHSMRRRDFGTIYIERIPVIQNKREIVWHIEDDSNRTLEITLELASKSFAFVWMSWNEDSQDFDRVSVSYDEIKHWLPTSLFS